VYILKNSDIYQKMLATKSLEWSYEEDLRIILHTDSNNNLGKFMKYPTKSLKSIIIGQGKRIIILALSSCNHCPRLPLAFFPLPLAFRFFRSLGGLAQFY
jgi:hypothetical protein